MAKVLQFSSQCLKIGHFHTIVANNSVAYKKACRYYKNMVLGYKDILTKVGGRMGSGENGEIDKHDFSIFIGTHSLYAIKPRLFALFNRILYVDCFIPCLERCP